MLNLSKKFDEDKFDAICIGNSLVHLDNYNEIESFSQLFENYWLIAGFVFQIISCRILSKKVTSLPTIENKEVPLKFERLYNLDESSGKVKFKTILHVENNEIINEVNLIPLLHDDAVSMLKKSGFNEIKTYGDFKRSGFDKETSYSLIVEAR